MSREENPICMKHPMVEQLCHRPWELSQEPFQISPRTYYVAGQNWVSVYLIDTGDGLILLDTGIAESVYLLIDSIYKLGYKPEDVQYILISHAHLDHFGGAAALRELTGAKIYMSKEDTQFMKECPEETELPHDLWHVQHIDVDCFYEENTPICLGDITIHTVLTPGHTVGCTSFYWKEKNSVTGEVYTLAMHGGVGVNTMSDEYYQHSRYLTSELRLQFLEGIEKLKNWKVDIALPSHPNQIEILEKAGTYTEKKQPYVDENIWGTFLENRAKQVRKLIKR